MDAWHPLPDRRRLATRPNALIAVMQLAELVVRVTAGIRVGPTLLVALFGLVQVNAPLAYAVWRLAGDCSLVQQCPCKLAIGALVA